MTTVRTDGLQHAGGWWLPASDEHMARWVTASDVFDGRGTYQYPKLVGAIGALRRWRTAIDVGAHIGTWSWVLAHLFHRVHAIEPVPLHVTSLRLNTADRPEVVIHPVAAGRAAGHVALATTARNTGESWVTGAGQLTMQPIDALDLWDIDLMKLDCEGYEGFVLDGALRTIEREWPVIIIEQDPQYPSRHNLTSTYALDRLRRLGYVERARWRYDYLMVHPFSYHAQHASAPAPVWPPVST